MQRINITSVSYIPLNNTLNTRALCVKKHVAQPSEFWNEELSLLSTLVQAFSIAKSSCSILVDEISTIKLKFNSTKWI